MPLVVHDLMSRDLVCASQVAETSRGSAPPLSAKTCLHQIPIRYLLPTSYNPTLSGSTPLSAGAAPGGKGVCALSVLSSSNANSPLPLIPSEFEPDVGDLRSISLELPLECVLRVGLLLTLSLLPLPLPLSCADSLLGWSTEAPRPGVAHAGTCLSTSSSSVCWSALFSCCTPRILGGRGGGERTVVAVVGEAKVAEALALGVTCGRMFGSVLVGDAVVAVTWVNICGATVYVTLDPVEPEPEPDVDDSDCCEYRLAMPNFESSSASIEGVVELVRSIILGIPSDPAD